jgi:hypothetical protein
MFLALQSGADDLLLPPRWQASNQASKSKACHSRSPNVAPIL